MNNVMIDLETMSTEPTAAILSIGAVTFDIEIRAITGRFYQNISLSSCILLGLHKSQSTLDWWAKDENKAARDALTKDAVDIREGLRRFIDWCEGPNKDEVIPWSNGAVFDIPIIKHAMHACYLKEPWKFYNESCYRTLKRLYPQIIPPSRAGLTKHNALDDSIFQATHLMNILSAIKVSEEVTTR